jgi:hypothetical protein
MGGENEDLTEKSRIFSGERLTVGNYSVQTVNWFQLRLGSDLITKHAECQTVEMYKLQLMKRRFCARLDASMNYDG